MPLAETLSGMVAVMAAAKQGTSGFPTPSAGLCIATAARVAEVGKVGPCLSLVASIQG